jgi:hypothetical protein
MQFLKGVNFLPSLLLFSAYSSSSYHLFFFLCSSPGDTGCVLTATLSVAQLENKISNVNKERIRSLHIFCKKQKRTQSDYNLSPNIWSICLPCTFCVTFLCAFKKTVRNEYSLIAFSFVSYKIYALG